jgi:hypothetical protein
MIGTWSNLEFVRAKSEFCFSTTFWRNRFPIWFEQVLNLAMWQFGSYYVDIYTRFDIGTIVRDGGEDWEVIVEWRSSAKVACIAKTTEKDGVKNGVRWYMMIVYNVNYDRISLYTARQYMVVNLVSGNTAKYDRKLHCIRRYTTSYTVVYGRCNVGELSNYDFTCKRKAFVKIFRYLPETFALSWGWACGCACSVYSHPYPHPHTLTLFLVKRYLPSTVTLLSLCKMSIRVWNYFSTFSLSSESLFSLFE